MSNPETKDICTICDKEKAGKMVFVKHHIDYSRDITILVCRPCHNWMHGRAVYGHPFRKLDKDIQPYYFAQRIIKAYKKHRKYL